ncbi:MAG TPA: transposase family protein [Pirellulaceae bacterium]|nr:transposase family protein [Pirellulaceae bacterium]
MLRLETLAEVFAQVKDHRDPRGKRHPLPAILSLVFLGLLARIRELAVLQRWAEVNWDLLKGPLGFDRDKPPHATTISRAIAACKVEEFEEAFRIWLKDRLPDEPFMAAVDAKTSRQGIDSDGEPVQLVTVVMHKLKLAIAQWSVRGDKTNESGVLKLHLPELCQQFPHLSGVSGDAIYANRPLAETAEAENRDYLVQIKDNQQDVREAVEHCLGGAHERPPAAMTAEKKGIALIGGGCGLI